MTSLLLGAGTFAFVLGFAVTFLIKKKRLSYSQHTWVFAPLYIFSSLVLILSIPESVEYLNQKLGIVVLIATALAFILFQFIWSRIAGGARGYGYETIPDNCKSILHLDARQALTKIFEILFQQICALLIILGLSELGFSVGWISVIFTIVVFALHIPSPKWFGKIYGNYFLWMSALLAPLIPWLILTFPMGFYMSASLHIFMYITLYSFAYWWRDNVMKVKYEHPRF